jgi:hypothetical protein
MLLVACCLMAIFLYLPPKFGNTSQAAGQLFGLACGLLLVA